MSVLTMCPSPEWYEAPDLLDDDEPEPIAEPELLTVTAAGLVWWTAAPLDIAD